MEAFKKRLLALDGRAAAQLVALYGPIWERLEGDIVTLMEQVLDQQMSFQQVMRLRRLEEIQSQVTRELARFGMAAGGQITGAQQQAVGLAVQSARTTVDAALPRGIDTQLLAQVGIQWNRLPAEALASFAGIAGDGAPLSNLLAPLGAEARDGILQGLAEGIALGKSPRETARLVRNRFGMPLTRALTISRTETLRAFREATRQQYQANPNVVKGYRRTSAKDSRVCMACIALDGKLYRVDEPLDNHPNCRCALVPEVISYRDLGLNIPDDDAQPETAGDWCKAQPEETQRQMMGNARFEAWQDGEIDLEDMVKISHNNTWGDAAVMKPLQESLR